MQLLMLLVWICLVKTKTLQILHLKLYFHHLANLVFEHPLDFILHCLGAGFAKMRPHPVGDVVNLLDHRGRRFRDGGSGDCLAGIVGHSFSFPIHQNGYTKGAFCAFDFREYKRRVQNAPDVVIRTAKCKSDFIFGLRQNVADQNEKFSL